MEQSSTPSNPETQAQELRTALARLREESVLEEVDPDQRVVIIKKGRACAVFLPPEAWAAISAAAAAHPT